MREGVEVAVRGGGTAGTAGRTGLLGEGLAMLAAVVGTVCVCTVTAARWTGWEVARPWTCLLGRAL